MGGLIAELIEMIYGAVLGGLVEVVSTNQALGDILDSNKTSSRCWPPKAANNEDWLLL